MSARGGAEPERGNCVARMRPAMGTFVAIEAEGERGAIAIDAAFRAIAELEASLHPQRPGSDLAALNHCDPQRAIAVRPDTLALLQLAQHLHTLTDGVFDPCLPRACGRMSDLLLHGDGCVVCRVPVALDLGGIAKGYAVDRAVEVLRAHGCSGGVVNAGGDLRAFGARARRAFIRDRDGRHVAIALREAALAVSDASATSRPSEHQGYYVRGAAAVLQRPLAGVIAARAVIADALTKCVLLCSTAVSERALRALGARSAPGLAT
jgi:thiamine biosynthesis lipoprotein